MLRPGSNVGSREAAPPLSGSPQISDEAGHVSQNVGRAGGAEARIAVGWVIVGGLGFATVFTLFLTPIFYRWIAVWGAEPGAAASRLRIEAAEIVEA